MIIKKFQFNPFPVNTYVVHDAETKECAIIDPGCYWNEELDQLMNYVHAYGLKVKYILHTHLHLDHALATPIVNDIFPDAVCCANEQDAFLLENAAQQAKSYGLTLPAEPIAMEQHLHDGDTLQLGNATLQVIAVPGHSPGSLCYLDKEGKAIFVGDVLFKQSIGRTDLPKGNHQDLLHNIKEKLFTLDDDITVYTGHGPETTIGEEKNFNPFF